MKKFMLGVIAMAIFGFSAVLPAAYAAQGHEDHEAAMNIVATAYAPGAHDNGKWENKTYLGTAVRPGIIAVDPNVIPLGSKVRIEFADGHSVEATAEDTGGAIKGNRIDIALNSVPEAYQFGIQNVKVYIVN
ncbi:MAG: 3D domain-containing protein [Veillonellales bacterium]